MRDLTYLTVAFVTWKGLILLLVRCAPGNGYDTSTLLLPSTSKLTRWDGIYFVEKARHGDIFEQEWAFGKGLSTLLGFTSRYSLDTTITAGILLSHIAHYAAVIILWKIASLLNTGIQGRARLSEPLPFVAACLHIISPAGVFLSAPYTESLFACLNMLGFWLYTIALHDLSEHRLLVQLCLIIAAGFTFGCATVIRSNGVLSGLPFLIDALFLTRKVLMDLRRGSIPARRSALLTSTIIAGCCIGAGLLLPQYLAWKEYCENNSSARPWCQQRLPLIYSFVQTHYWGVGFLRYWTISNLPLFLLAIPVLLVMLLSSINAIMSSTVYAKPGMPDLLLDRLAAPQFVLAILSITHYHVQIITRLSSGYPWLYIWLAQKICKRAGYAQAAVTFCIMYATIQTGLFASFLPPA